jgi:hypothetical protein
MVLVALAWRVFGESRLVAHAVELPFLPLGMVGTYFLGKRLGGPCVGAAAGVLFGTTAVAVSEYGQVYVDLPLAALVACGLGLFVWERFAAAAVLFVLAALVKLPSLAVPLTLLAWEVGDRERRRRAALLALLAPVVAHAGWLVYHAQVTDWWLVRPGRRRHTPGSLDGLASTYATVGASLVLAQFRWVPAVAALGGACWAAGKKVAVPWRAMAPLAGVVIAGVFVFAFAGEFGLRYALFLMPPMFVAELAVVRHAVPRGAWAAAGTGIVTAALFMTTWHPRLPPTDHYVYAPDQDMRYRDMIVIGERAARYLQRHQPDAEVVGSFPESYQVTEPYQGYVDRAFPFVECDRYTGSGDRAQIVYVHPYSPGQPACKRLVEEAHATPLARFSSNDKWVELYEMRR